MIAKSLASGLTRGFADFADKIMGASKPRSPGF
jgi:hypothetical protein